ncbi:DUF771 domain-containing protein [Marinilactibacillus psychrotolerans]|uniref:DUF771 domain-containing protein n=1 Tax=Marinilactibacillus psychrotolerans TaxID=191770 RepID=A0A5R9C615_9LACT|nr:DUF771 domain-containing protein [Marinilactibacillus psychrotolerans]TLQ08508.1 DUF771 domain-containing protein [Marinilactibacillus psychrotolerans]
MTQLTITIPEAYVVLTKEEFKELKDKQDERVWITFTDLQEIAGLKRTKLDEVLTHYRDELDLKNGGPVKYADGGKYSINKKPMQKWLEENHTRVWMNDLYYQ